MKDDQAIYQIIKDNQPLSFAEFMQLALYHPQQGYYSSALPFGPEGDFITAPELTPLFGQTLANQCIQIFKVLNEPVLIEFGAGTGKLCVDLLHALESENHLPSTYFILEVSGRLRKMQEERFTEEIPHLLDRIQWLSQWPTTPINGVMIANEVLDAMPVHRFMQTAEQLLESMVSLNEQGELVEEFLPCQNPKLNAYLNKVLPRELFPYVSEVNLYLEGWIKQCHDVINQGVLLLLDYGFPRHELYHPDRNQGTLMCHYRHQAHSNPFINLGQQDITAHVDFTHVAESGHASGFHVAGYTNQASFLLSNGLLSLFERTEDERERFQAQQAVKQLVQPSEMGELFKVIALTKGIHFPLQGFQLHDKRASL